MILLPMDEVVIKVDPEGRFCIGDLHKAAVSSGRARPNQYPGEFLKLDSVKAFIKALDQSNLVGVPAVNKVEGGSSPSIYVTGILATKYAAWIDPALEVLIYQSFKGPVIPKGDDPKVLVSPKLVLKDKLSSVWQKLLSTPKVLSNKMLGGAVKGTPHTPEDLSTPHPG